MSDIYPGLVEVGPPRSTVGWQVRQSKAGRPGKDKTVVDSMGTTAPALAVAAQAITVLQMAAEAPFSIEQGF